MKEHVWLIEDDPKMVRQLQPLLRRELDVEVTPITTEAEFRRDYEFLADSAPPSAVIIDVALSWTNWKMPAIPRPIECNDEGLGGLRCRDLLGSLPQTAMAPVVFYTHFSPYDMRNARTERLRGAVLTKRAEHKELIAHLRYLLNRSACTAFVN
jgi:DNA-binding NarL/FixJ family response regulator